MENAQEVPLCLCLCRVCNVRRHRPVLLGECECPRLGIEQVVAMSYFRADIQCTFTRSPPRMTELQLDHDWITRGGIRMRRCAEQ
jgi:hypothetical protein